jgi:cell division protein FtsI (penicillin-binding protein 3)
VRLHLELLVVLLVLALIAVRLVWLQTVQAGAYTAQAVEQRLSSSTVLAPRGEILDRNGNVLAMSVDARAVYAEPRNIARAACKPGRDTRCDPAKMASTLAKVLGVPAAELEDKLTRPGSGATSCSRTRPEDCSGFVYLARGLEPDVGDRVRDLGLVGVGTLKEPRRVAPGGELAANVIGFTGVDDRSAMTGAAGVELGLNSVLQGKDGRTTVEVDGSGRVLPTGERTVVEPTPGRAVQLTLDRDLQWYTQDVLARQVAATNAESGSAVVMDVSTGDVLALASVPTFDANDASAAPAELRGNRALSDVFEPGSVGKVITAAAALEAGVVTPDTVLAVDDRIRLAGKDFKDSHDHPVEQMTFTGVLVESSNVGTIMVAQKLGGERLHEALLRFGLGQKTGLGLPGESRGIVPELEDWSGTAYGAIPIGQSYSVNGVQMAAVYAAIANGGLRVQPRIVMATEDETGDTRPVQPSRAPRILSETVAAQLRGMLEGVTGEEGTGPLAAVPGYRVAGKTGTAQRVVDGRYQGYTASFVGFAPADAPRLVISVSLQDPKNGYYGGAVAAPVFGDVMSFALRSAAVPPTGTVAPRLRLRADDPA